MTLSFISPSRLQKVFLLAQLVKIFASPGRVTQVPQKVW